MSSFLSIANIFHAHYVTTCNRQTVYWSRRFELNKQITVGGVVVSDLLFRTHCKTCYSRELGIKWIIESEEVVTSWILRNRFLVLLG